MFETVKQNRVFERIVEQILEAIFRGDLTPNDKLPSENELTQIFGVSRGTVREAIRTLEQDGVIEVRQGMLGGAYIKEMDLDDVVKRIESALHLMNVTFQQLAEARAILEKILLRELIPSRMKKEYLDRMEATIAAAELHFKNRRNKERLLANFEFHTRMTEISGNPIIILMHKLIVNLSIYFFENVEPSVPMIKKTVEYHKKIIDLLRRGEFESAADVCSRHIREVSARIVEKSKQQSLLDRYK